VGQPVSRVRIGTAVALVIVVLGLLPGAAAAMPTASRAVPLVVVLGVDGLTWADIDLRGGSRVPRLADLVRSSATGVLATKGAGARTSVIDGWATLSAGGRAAAGAIPPPAEVSDPGVLVAQRRTDRSRSGARVGALAAAVGCVDTAGGRGAALAAARPDGAVTTRPDCPLRLLEAASPAAAEQALATIAAGPTPDLLLVVGVGDARPAEPHLHVAALQRPGGVGARLTSASTARVPYVQLVDVAPTVLAALGLPIPASMSGQPIRVVPGSPSGAADVVAADRAARLMRRAVPVVVTGLLTAAAVALCVAGGLWRRGRPEQARRLASATAAGVAATPVATFLARLVPYGRWGLPGLLLTTAAAACLVVAGCRARTQRIAALTLLVLAADLLSGARLQLHSVLGYSALVAGRFAGVGNPASGVLLAATLITAGAVAGRLPGPRVRAAAVLAVGGLGLAVDGWPTAGSDLGGVLALTPAVVLLAVHAAGRPVRGRAVVLAAGSAALCAALLAAVDLARPAGTRTHLGRFAADVVHGRAGPTLARKAAAELDLLASPVAALIPVVVVVLALVLRSAARGARPGRAGRRDALHTAIRQRPLLGPTLAACLLAAGLGLLVNDSGVALAATLLLLAVPVGLQAAVTAPIAPVPTAASPIRSGGPGAPSPDGPTADVPWPSVGSPVGRARQTAEAT